MVAGGDGARVYDLDAERSYDQALGTEVEDGRQRKLSLPFVFAPFVLALFLPLAALPYQQAELAWYIGNVAVLLSVPLLLRRHIKPRIVMLCLLVSPCFVPAVLALLQGQPSPLILLFFALMYLDLCAGRDLRAGCWLALAAIKPQLVIPALAALLVWKNWRALAGFTAAAVSLLALSAGLVGWHATLGYPRALLTFTQLQAQSGGEHTEGMPNLRGLISAMLENKVSSLALSGVSAVAALVLVVAVMLVLRLDHRTTAASMSLLVIATLLASHHAYLHDATLLLLPMLLMGQASVVAGWRLRIATLVLLGALIVLPLSPMGFATTCIVMSATMIVWAVFSAGCLIGDREPEVPVPSFDPAV